MNSLPGLRDGHGYTPRQVLFSTAGAAYLPGGGVLKSTSYDGANTSYEDEIRVGTPLGRITATKLWRPCPRTVVNGSATSTSLVVVDSRAFIVGDVITVGADTTITVTAINYTTHTLTIASTTFVDGEVVFAEDGSGVCRGILNEFVKIKDKDGVRGDRTISKILVSGLLDETMILGDYAAIRAASGMYISDIKWADQQGAH